MPIYLNGSLQYFADVRAANNLADRLTDFHRKFDAAINEQIADSENHEALTAERTFPARTASSVGEGR